MMAGVLLCGMVLAAQPGGDGSPPADTSPVEERLAAVRSAPTDPRARLELGLAYLQAEEYDFAMAELVEAITLNPDNRDNLAAQANYHLGTALLAIDRAALAVNAFREALKLGWRDAGVYLALGQALTSQGKFDDAIAQYREALRLAPGTTEAYAGLGLAYEASGRVDEAVTQYERFLQSAPATDDHGVDAIKQRLAKLKERRKM
jgi:tetratricopeptide (TPR) repeat protein